MLVANAVVDTDQPRLQVGENQMDDRQVLLGNLWITTLGNSEVLIAALTEASIAAPIVSNVSDPGATVLIANPRLPRRSIVRSVVELGARLSIVSRTIVRPRSWVSTGAMPERSLWLSKGRLVRKTKLDPADSGDVRLGF